MFRPASRSRSSAPETFIPSADQQMEDQRARMQNAYRENGHSNASTSSNGTRRHSPRQDHGTQNSESTPEEAQQQLQALQKMINAKENTARHGQRKTMGNRRGRPSNNWHIQNSEQSKNGPDFRSARREKSISRKTGKRESKHKPI